MDSMGTNELKSQITLPIVKSRPFSSLSKDQMSSNTILLVACLSRFDLDVEKKKSELVIVIKFIQSYISPPIL